MSRNVIDLSYTVEHAMEVFPADPPVGILKHHCYKNGYFVSQIIMGTHSGTHVDAPVHKLPETRSITDLKVEQREIITPVSASPVFRFPPVISSKEDCSCCFSLRSSI